MAFGFTHAFPKIYILCCFLLAAELGMICFRQDLGSSHGGCVFLPSEAKKNDRLSSSDKQLLVYRSVLYVYYSSTYLVHILGLQWRIHSLNSTGVACCSTQRGTYIYIYILPRAHKTRSTGDRRITHTLQNMSFHEICDLTADCFLNLGINVNRIAPTKCSSNRPYKTSPL